MHVFKSVRIVGHSDVQDILVENGRIADIGIGLSVPPTAKVHQWQEEVWASAGWLDVGVFAGDPGHEHREDLLTATQAAAAGGFTGIVTLPTTDPATDTKSAILYVRHKTANLPVQCFPLGALSAQCAGKDLAELYDLHTAGAVAFSDGEHPVQDAGLLLRALQYTQAFDGLVFQRPLHASLSAQGHLHEGEVSTRMGLRGIPSLAEALTVQRDLSLQTYAGGRLHFHLLSTAESVDMVRQAKAKNASVTASVAIANLCFTDTVIEGFDAQWKVMPPLRSAADATALMEGVLDGTIDFICTNHTPWHTEAKELEFPYAAFGMIGLQTTYSLYQMYLADRLPIEIFVEKISAAPRRVLGLPPAQIAVGETANMTFFQPEKTWTLRADNLRSRSQNTPFLGQTLRGRVLGICRDRYWVSAQSEG